MGYFEGLLGGFARRKGEVEAYNLDEARRSSDREARVLELLLNSGDPEIQSLAATGLLASTQPGKRKGGLKGWLGEMEANPAMAEIQRLIQTPVRETRQVQTGPPAVEGYLPGTPPPVESAALPVTSPTQGGLVQRLQVPDVARESVIMGGGFFGGRGASGRTYAESLAGSGPTVTRQAQDAAAQSTPPAETDTNVTVQGVAGPRDLGPLGSDPRLIGAAPPTTAMTTSRPRQVFRTQEDQAIATARARAQGDVEGMVAGLVASGVPEAEARVTAQQHLARQYGRGAGAAGGGRGVGEGEIIPDPASDTGWSQILYDRNDPTKQTRIQAGAPYGRATRAVNPLEVIAAKRYGLPGEDPRAVLSRISNNPEQIQSVLLEKRELDAQDAAAITAARGGAAAAAPLTVQQRFEATTELQQLWQKHIVDWTSMNTSVGKLESTLDAVKRGAVAAGSEAFLLAWEKALDPPSVVREAEAERPGTMQSLLTRASQALARLRSGGSAIPPAEMEKYLMVARDMRDTVGRLAAGKRQQISTRAMNSGLDLDEIFAANEPGASFGLSPTVGTPPPVPSGTAVAPAAAPTVPGTKKVGNKWMITLP